MAKLLWVLSGHSSGNTYSKVGKLLVCRAGFPMCLCEVSPNPASSVVVSCLVCAELTQDGPYPSMGHPRGMDAVRSSRFWLPCVLPAHGNTTALGQAPGLGVPMPCTAFQLRAEQVFPLHVLFLGCGGFVHRCRSATGHGGDGHGGAAACLLQLHHKPAHPLPPELQRLLLLKGAELCPWFCSFLTAFIVTSDGAKRTFLSLSLGSVDLKSKCQSPGAWWVMTGVEVSCCSIENRCVQGNCRDVKARTSTAEH